jgi:hypothetical protein
MTSRTAPVSSSVRRTRAAKSERPAVAGVTGSAASEDLSPRGETPCCSFSCGVIEPPAAVLSSPAAPRATEETSAAAAPSSVSR